MNDARLRRVRNDLAAMVEDRRAERRRKAPCPECGNTLAESVRLVDPGASACETCEERAAESGGEIVTMWPPRGLDGDPDEAA